MGKSEVLSFQENISENHGLGIDVGPKVSSILSLKERFKNFQTCQNNLSGRKKLDIFPIGSIFDIEKLEDLERFDDRLVFKNDTKSIKGSMAFRRLSDKAQVVPESGNIDVHVRTRSVHTEEVVNVSFYIAKYLNIVFDKLGLDIEINSDLCEAIAYGHDIGHTPFGHIGEDFLREKGYNFEHNIFSVIIAQFVEKGGKGLNLNNETLMGFIKHTSNGGKLEIDGLQERAIVRLADKIAYVIADLSDAISMGFIEKDSDIDSAMLLGNTQEERRLNLIKEVVQQTLNNGFITLGEGEIAKQFKNLKNELIEKFYNKKDERDRNKYYGLLEKVFDFLKNNETRLDPGIALAFLTDSEVIRLSDLIDKGFDYETIKLNNNFSIFDIIKEFEENGNNPLDIKINSCI